MKVWLERHKAIRLSADAGQAAMKQFTESYYDRIAFQGARDLLSDGILSILRRSAQREISVCLERVESNLLISAEKLLQAAYLKFCESGYIPWSESAFPTWYWEAMPKTIYIASDPNAAREMLEVLKDAAEKVSLFGGKSDSYLAWYEQVQHSLERRTNPG